MNYSGLDTEIERGGGEAGMSWSGSWGYSYTTGPMMLRDNRAIIFHPPAS